jgi:hypothetical protein
LVEVTDHEGRDRENWIIAPGEMEGIVAMAQQYAKFGVRTSRLASDVQDMIVTEISRCDPDCSVTVIRYDGSLETAIPVAQ